MQRITVFSKNSESKDPDSNPGTVESVAFSTEEFKILQNSNLICIIAIWKF